MNPESYRTFNRRGREQELTARPLLVLYRGESTGSHNNQKQNKKPFTQISLQNLPDRHTGWLFFCPCFHKRVFLTPVLILRELPC